MFQDDDSIRRIMEILATKGLPQMEKNQQDQMVLAQQLRGMAPPSQARNDWGSNVGRAAYGIAGALQNVAARKTLGGITGAKENYFQNLMADYLRKKRAEDMGVTAQGHAQDLGYAGPDAAPEE